MSGHTASPDSTDSDSALFTVADPARLLPDPGQGSGKGCLVGSRRPRVHRRGFHLVTPGTCVRRWD